MWGLSAVWEQDQPADAEFQCLRSVFSGEICIFHKCTNIWTCLQIGSLEKLLPLPSGYLHVPGTDPCQRDKHFQYEDSVRITDSGDTECVCQCRGCFGGSLVLLPWVVLNFPFCEFGHTHIFA